MTDELLVVNLAQPTQKTVEVPAGNRKMTVDVQKLKEAADRLGAGKWDVLSIGGYRNAKGELVPDYDTVRIERHGTDTEH